MDNVEIYRKYTCTLNKNKLRKGKKSMTVINKFARKILHYLLINQFDFIVWISQGCSDT